VPRAGPHGQRRQDRASGLGSREAVRVDVLNIHFDRQADHLRRLANDLSAQTHLSERLSALDLKRSRYQDQQAEGLITTDELRTKLAGIEEERQALRGELDKIGGARDALTRLITRGDALLERSANGFFDQLISHGPEERRKAYLDMGLRVELDDEGNPIISGAFGTFSKEESSSTWRRTLKYPDALTARGAGLAAGPLYCPG
jgi:hypothetical protein